MSVFASRILCSTSRIRPAAFFLPALLLLLPTPLATAAIDPAAFAYRKPVLASSPGADDVLAAVLDSEVYAAGAADGRDLRILDDRGQEIPSLLRRRDETITQTVHDPVAAKTVSLRELPDNRIEIELALYEQAPAADGFTIDTPLHDYERAIRVQGSTDGQAWTPLVADGMVFDYARFLDFSQHEVALPANTARRFKIEIGNIADDVQSPFMELTREFRAGGTAEREVQKTGVTHRNFRIDRVRFWRNVEQERVRRPLTAAYPAGEITVTTDAKKQQTLVDIRMRREPVTAFILDTTSRNFSRITRLQVPQAVTGREEWRDVATGTLANFQFRALRKEWLKLEFSPQREERYRLVIENGDNPALDIRALHAEGEAYELLFLAAAGRQYALLYGAPAVKAPVYDTAQVLAGIGNAAQAKTVKLGPQEVQSATAGQTPWWHTLNRRALFFAAIVLMVVVLAWGLFRAGKRIDQVSE